MHRRSYRSEFIAWRLYLICQVVIPTLMLIAVMIPNDENINDQIATIIWICGMIVFRSFLPARKYLYDNYNHNDFYTFIMLIYVFVSVIWFFYGVLIVSMKIAFNANYDLWLLSLCSLVSDSVLTIIVYPCCLSMRRNCCLECMDDWLEERQPQIPSVVNQLPVQDAANILPVNQQAVNQQEGVPNLVQERDAAGIAVMMAYDAEFERLEREARQAREEKKKQDTKIQEEKKKSKIVNHVYHITCAVCTDQFKENDIVSDLPCKHLFHPGCLEPWLITNNTCPVCRYDLKS
jgi:hypothetical protein